MLTLQNVEKIVFDYYIDFLLYLSLDRHGVSLMALYDQHDFEETTLKLIKEELYDFVEKVNKYNPTLLNNPGQLGIDFIMLRNYQEDNIVDNQALYGEDSIWLSNLCKSYKPLYLYEFNNQIYLR